jgi:hypothetical protein
MMRMRFMITAVALIVGVAFTMLAEPRPLTASVQGRITDLFGSPVAVSVVEVISAGREQPFRARTDEQGNYKFGSLPTGQLTLTVHSAGFLQEERTTFLSSGEQQVLDIGLEVGQLSDLPPIEISGTVRQQNSALQDATVTIVSAFNQRLIKQVKTDATGRYKVSVSNPGQYVIYASKPGFVVNATTVLLPTQLPRERRTVDLMLAPLRSP